MKEHLVIAALSLLCFPAFSQEANEPGRGAAELTAVARAEYPLDGTSLYTLLEGNISDNLSYSISNHWLSSEPGTLYSNTLRSDDVNWLDWAYLTCSFGSFEISAGKDMLPWGTIEMDQYDFDVYSPLASTVWNMLPVYQWGVRASWLPTDEMTFDMRVSTSPYGEHPFASGLYTLGLRGRYTTDATDFMAAYNVLQDALGQPVHCFSAGLSQTIGDWTLVLDYNSRPCGDEIFGNGFGVAADVVWQAAEQSVVKCHFSEERLEDLTFRKLGAVYEWSPVEELRIHALAGKDFGNAAPGLLYSIGLTYKFSTSF